MCLLLSLSIYQQDKPTYLLCHMMLLNVIVTQGLKRLVFRQRPSDNQPPRAHKLIEIGKTSGLPSSMIVTATTFTYAVFSIDSWILDLEGLNSVTTWASGLIALSTFVMVCLCKIHLGQNYPSDCLLCIFPILLIIALWYLLQWFDTLIQACPSCLNYNGNESFCYFES